MKICSHCRVGSSLLGLIVLVILGHGCGQTPGTGPGIESFRGNVRMSDDKKTITSAIGKGTKAYQGTPSQMASQFLTDHVNQLGLTAGLGDLSLLSKQVSRFGSSVE